MPALRNAVSLVQLHGTEVGEEQDIRGNGAHIEAFERAGILEQHPPRPEAHREAEFLRDAR